MNKSCPYCAEVIKKEAIKCKHCGEWLNKNETPIDQTKKKSDNSNSDSRKFKTEKIIKVIGSLFTVISFGQWPNDDGNLEDESALAYANYSDLIITEDHLFVFAGKLRSSIDTSVAIPVAFLLIFEGINKLRDVNNKKEVDLSSAPNLSKLGKCAYAKLSDLTCSINPVQSKISDRINSGSFLFSKLHYSKASFAGKFIFKDEIFKGNISFIMSDDVKSCYSYHRNNIPQLKDVKISNEVIPRDWVGCVGI